MDQQADDRIYTLAVDPVPKTIGICGETAFAQLDPADPCRRESARQVMAQVNRQRGPYKTQATESQDQPDPGERPETCPACESPWTAIRRELAGGNGRACRYRWHDLR